MRVIQILPTLGWGDAVGNDTRAIYRILKEKGYDTVIGAEAVDRRIPKEEAAELKDLPEIRPEDLVIVFSFRDYYIRARTIARYASQRGVPVILITDSLRSPAVNDSAYVFLCPTIVRASVNSFTTPVSLINILTQCVALRLGKETLEDIAESMRRVNRFMTTETDR